MPSYVMVLNDGETFTNVEGCAIVEIPGNVTSTEDVEAFLGEDDLDATVAYFDVTDRGMPTMVVVRR